jgi:3',5'-cyclic AMP phosphodiesterase CpdA
MAVNQQKNAKRKMPANLRLAFTADLHWGIRQTGDEATRLLIAFLNSCPPDALVLAGDVGAGQDFENCLTQFADLHCQKALVPGNHDLWVTENDPRGDSLQVYQEVLPRICSKHGFHYLDQGPFVFPGANLALVGSINWYDYSWSIEQLREKVADWQKRLRTKTFSRGRHNDGRFIRWPLDDVRFTAEVVAVLENHLQQALGQVGQAIIVTHHPSFAGLSFPRLTPPMTVDALLWDAFTGNHRLEELLVRHADRIPLVLCGHTHRERENRLGNIRGYNIGGDYHFKRLLILDWPAGTVEAHVFGDPEG